MSKKQITGKGMLRPQMLVSTAAHPWTSLQSKDLEILEVATVLVIAVVVVGVKS